MNKIQSDLDKVRKDAQLLHQQISDNITKAKALTAADVKAAQANMKILADNMKVVAHDQSDAVKTSITSAIDKMENAGKADVAETADDFKHASEVMLDGVRKATQSLSQAVAEMRTKVADKIAPKNK